LRFVGAARPEASPYLSAQRASEVRHGHDGIEVDPSSVSCALRFLDGARVPWI